MTKYILTAVAMMVVGCGGGTFEAPTPSKDCAGSADPTACDDCVANAPRGEVGDPICQSEGGWQCCSTTQADGSCSATYGDSKSKVSAACGPVVVAECQCWVAVLPGGHQEYNPCPCH